MLRKTSGIIAAAVSASDRKNLKAGMTCEIAYELGEKNEPSTMDCR